jgi:ribosome-binding protein aMBF1 (putative translation factor)
MTAASPSRKKTIAARRRAKKYRRVYRKLASIVKLARRKMCMTQPEFAAYLGVSEISVRRWETALGHKPNIKVRQKIRGRLNGDTVNSGTPVFGAFGTRN